MATRVPYISYRPGAVFDDRKRFTEKLPIRVDEDDCCSIYDPVAIHFPPQNVAVGYDLSNAGPVFERTYDITLGTGGVTYAPYAEDRSAIYNLHDDRMYFLATRTVAAVATPVMVRFDPRALAIEAYATIPGGGTVNNSTLVDVADERLWISHDSILYCYDTITLTEVFNDSGDFIAIDSNINAGIACRSGQFLIGEDGDPTALHLMTVTGPTTYIDMPIAILDGGSSNNVLFSNNGSFRRRWIGDRNKVFLMYGAVPDGGIMYALADLNDLSVETFYSPAGASYDMSERGPYWDHYSQRLCGAMVDAVGGGDYGIFIGSDTGVTLGFANFNGSDWGTGGQQPLGDTVVSVSQTIYALGGFSTTTISNTPSEIFETSDSMISPLTYTFNPDYMCIAPRRKVVGAVVTI